MVTHILERWAGLGGGGGGAEEVKTHGCMWATGWEKELVILLSIQALVTSIPKKRFERVCRIGFDRRTVKKMHMDSAILETWGL